MKSDLVEWSQTVLESILLLSDDWLKDINKCQVDLFEIKPSYRDTWLYLETLAHRSNW